MRVGILPSHEQRSAGNIAFKHTRPVVRNRALWEEGLGITSGFPTRLPPVLPLNSLASTAEGGRGRCPGTIFSWLASLWEADSWKPLIWERKNVKAEQEEEMKQCIYKWLRVKEPVRCHWADISSVATKIRKVLRSKLLNFGRAGYSSSQTAQFVGYNNFSWFTLRSPFGCWETEQFFFNLRWSSQCYQNMVSCGDSYNYSWPSYHLIVGIKFK